LSIGGLVLLLGALLDTISNAISIITPTLTYILSGVVLGGIPILLVLEKRKLLKISHKDGSTFSILDRTGIASVTALLIVLWIPRLFSPQPPNLAQMEGGKPARQGLPAPNITEEGGVATQWGFLETLSGEHDVYYPRAFTAIPNLTFSKKVDNIYFETRYEITEQRRDGFKIKFTAFVRGGAIQWIAVGVLDKPS